MRVTIRNLGLLLLLAAFLPVPAASAQQARPAVAAATQVTANPNPVRGHSTPQLARNPKTGELVVAEVDIRGTRECSVYISADDGRSWAPGGYMMVKPFTDCSIGAEYGPHVMPFFDKNGVLYVAMTANDPKDFASDRPRTRGHGRSFVPRNVYLARSTDGGRSFDTRLVFQAPKGNPGLGYNIAPVGAVDPKDPSNVYVGWSQGDWTELQEDQTVRAAVAASRDGGKTFGPAVDISAGEKSTGYPWVAVGSDGTVHAVYWASGFGKPLAEEGMFLPFARKEPQPILYNRSTDHGATWSRQAIDRGNQAYYRPPVIAADPNSEAVYVVWNGNEEPMNWALQGEHKDRTNIFLRASEDNGKTWSDRRIVNDDPGRGVNHVLPGASVAPTGRLDIAWHDYRLSPKPADNPDDDLGLQDIFYTYSEDRGRTFAPNVRVTDRSIDRSIGVWSNNIGSQINVGIASAKDGAYFAWSDSRNGNTLTQAEDIYAATVKLEGAALAATDSDDGLPAWVALGAGLAVGLGLTMGLVWLVSRRGQSI